LTNRLTVDIIKLIEVVFGVFCGELKMRFGKISAGLLGIGAATIVALIVLRPG